MSLTSELHDRRVSLCGVNLHLLTRDDLLELVGSAVASRERVLVLHHNLHSLYLYETNSSFRNVYRRASAVYIDGLPLVWVARAAALPLTCAHRITFLDSFESVLAEAEHRHWRVFYLGSKPAVAEKARALFQKLYPRLHIQVHDGYFDKSGRENDLVVQQINDFKTDILFVGMGMPLQEYWIQANYARFSLAATFTCGATLDYVTGDAYRPPEWAGALGLYGLFRLAADPLRLWRRYLIEPFVVACAMFPRFVRQRLARESRLLQP